MTEGLIRAILVKPGEEPVICALPIGHPDQTEAISDLLEGNFGATEFFDLGNGVSLFILSNDLSIPLGLPANRRFPGKDSEEIIFGSAIFIAANNDRSEAEGTIDMPERICHMFIEQIKLNFVKCEGDEQPSSGAEVYIENEGTPEERAYKWREIDKPEDIDQAEFVAAGRAKWYSYGNDSILSINDRYFRQVQAVTSKTPLN